MSTTTQRLVSAAKRLAIIVFPTICCFAGRAAAEPQSALAMSNDWLSLSVGGRLKLDLVASTTSPQRAGSDNYTLRPGAVPLDEHRDHATLSLRASRLWLKAAAPSLGADAYFEVDAFGQARGNESLRRGYDLRLRHGYGVWRNWLGGHTYTTFMNLSAFPELNDDGIPAGAVFMRQPVVRYTWEAEHFELAVAAEMSNTTFVAPGLGSRTADAPEFPDWIVRYTRFSRRGNWSVSGMVRELRVDRGRAPRRDDALGFAANFSGRRALGNDDELRYMFSVGNALGRYMSVNGFDDARLDGDGRIERNLSAGGYLAWQHWWRARWRSNLVAGFARQSYRGIREENRWLASSHTNLLWDTAGDTTLGIELMTAYRDRFDGRDGFLARLQLTAEYRF